MYTVLTVVHILVSVVLITVILMQSQQSMNLSGMFGGASQSALGSQPQSVLSRTTTVLAIVFIVTSLVFAFYEPGGQSALAPESTSSPPARAPAPAPAPEDGSASGNPNASGSPASRNAPAQP